jgi:hypothetical protein
VHILRELWARKPLVIAVAVVALGAAILAGYRVSPGVPPSLERRALDIGAASSQLLVDAPRSSLTNLNQDPVVLATRALVYAQAMASPQARTTISEGTGYPPNDIVTKGPFSSEADRVSYQTQPAEERANELLSEGAPYRLLFDAQPDLPLISVYAQAPSASEAVILADGATAALKEYVAELQSAEVPENKRVVVRELGTAEGGAVASGGGLLIMLLAFVGTFLVGCALVLLFTRLATEWRRVAAEEALATPAPAPAAGSGRLLLPGPPANGAAADEAEDEPPVRAVN